MPEEEGTEATSKENTSEETTPKVQAPTETEEVKSLREKVQLLTAEVEKEKKQYKGLQGSLQEKVEQLKRRDNLDSQIAAIEDRIELLATGIVSGHSEEEMAALPKEDRGQILAKIRKQRQETDEKRKQAEVKAQQDEYNQKANAIYESAKDVFKDDIEAIASVRNMLRQGDLDLAEKKIEKAKPKETMEKPKESEEERIKKAVDERVQAIMKEKGLLKTDGVQPSGNKTRTPTYEELKASSPANTAAKVKSGEWIIPGWGA